MAALNRTQRQRQQDCLQTVLRQFRQDSGLRQADLADRIGEPQSFVSKYESGERRLDILEVRAICLAIGTPLAALLEQLEACIGETTNEG